MTGVKGAEACEILRGLERRERDRREGGRIGESQVNHRPAGCALTVHVEEGQRRAGGTAERGEPRAPSCWTAGEER